MQALRWTLGIVSGVVGIGWVVLGVFGNSFRASFGASAVDGITRLGPLIVMALVLASVVGPGNRVLLHVTAVVVAAACVGGAMVMRESAFVGTLCLLYCTAWFCFYAKTAW